MKYIISSNIQYYSHTYPAIVKSILDSQIEPKDILFVIGGSDTEYSHINEDGIFVAYVSYNSFDLTSLIFVANNLDTIKDSNYFLFHDTCLVGPNFKMLSQNFKDSDEIKTLRSGISLNIGMYSKKCIEESIEVLNSLKFYPKNKEELQSVKQVFVVNEDIIFKRYPNYCYVNNYIGSESDSITIEDLRQRFLGDTYKEYFDTLESSKINRQMGYSPLLDFYKFQANSSWGNEWKIGV